MIMGAYRMDFTEVEPGWGQRPDGSMLFPSKTAADAYAVSFKEKERERLKAAGGHGDYSYPGTPYMVEITKEQSDRLASEGAYWIKY